MQRLIILTVTTWEPKPKRQVCYSGEGTLLSEPFAKQSPAGFAPMSQISGLLASLETRASYQACTAGEVKSSPRPGQAQRWLWTHAFPQVLGSYYKLTSGAMRTGIRTGTSVKEFLTQTPLPPGIHVLQRLAMDDGYGRDTPYSPFKIVPPAD